LTAKDGGAGGSERVVLRLMGGVILLLTLAPVHWILRQPGTGRFGESAVMRNASNVEMAWWGILLAVGIGAVLAILAPTPRARSALQQMGRALAGVPLRRFAMGLGFLATAWALLAGLWLFHGLPTLVDGMVTRLQGRTLAHGMAALQLPSPRAAWLIPNTVLTSEGWVSQYPPLPALLLALGEWAGVPWLVFPLLVGGTVTLTTLLAGRLFGEDAAVTRLGAILLAVSPFMAFLGGGYLSHVPAAAFVALTLYATHRAQADGWRWSLLVGIGSGAAVVSRPLPGLLLAVVVPAVWWAWTSLRRGGFRWLLSRLAGAAAGGMPFALALGAYNRHFFGGWTRLGYSAAFGPSHDLGFHLDPWGNLYSPLEALGFTAVDLTGLGTYLLETPLPATALVGLFLLLGRALPTGGRVILAWALLPILGNFFYWHHGFHLGPRMLYEAAPAWILLTAMAALGLARAKPAQDSDRRIPPLPDLALWTLLVSLVGGGILVGNRVLEYRWAPETLARISVPRLPVGEPSLVFVHGSWSERITARLQDAGMRLDSIETALHRNDVCLLHLYALAREGALRGEAGADPGAFDLDFEAAPEAPSALEPVYLSEGNRILVDPRRPVAPACEMEARADARGIISLAPLLWQGDLPGMEDGLPMFVRDLGPGENRRILEAFPERRPYVLMTPAPEGRPLIRDYEEGMQLIWGGESS